MSTPNGLARRVDRLQQRLRPHDCPYPEHGAITVVVLRAGDPDPEPVRCPGCGDPRPVAAIQLVEVGRDDDGELIVVTTEPPPIVVAPEPLPTNGTAPH